MLYKKCYIKRYEGAMFLKYSNNLPAVEELVACFFAEQLYDAPCQIDAATIRRAVAPSSRRAKKIPSVLGDMRDRLSFRRRGNYSASPCFLWP
jgi:hypothetical protein